MIFCEMRITFNVLSLRLSKSLSFMLQLRLKGMIFVIYFVIYIIMKFCFYLASKCAFMHLLSNMSVKQRAKKDVYDERLRHAPSLLKCGSTLSSDIKMNWCASVFFIPVDTPLSGL